ncbi:MAG TPA: WG repeat-containing protein [Bacteroidia bacterium]|jgi:hypothetical protein
MKKLALFFGLLASAMANAQGLESLMAVYKDGVFMIDLDTNSLPRFKGFNGFTQANLKENRDSTGGNYFPVYHFNSRYDGKKWGIVDWDGRTIGNCEYDLLFPYMPYNQKLSGNVPGLLACRDGKWGMVNGAGKILIPFMYDLPFADEASGDCYFTQMKNNADLARELSRGEMMLEDGIFSFPMVGSNMVFLQNGKYGMVDTTGKVVVPFKYSAITFSITGIHQLQEGKKTLYCTSNGMILNYDMVQPTISGLHSVKKKGKWGYIDNNGKLIVPCKYDLAGDMKRDTGSDYCHAGVAIGDTYYELRIYDDGRIEQEE